MEKPLTRNTYGTFKPFVRTLENTKSGIARVRLERQEQRRVENLELMRKLAEVGITFDRC